MVTDYILQLRIAEISGKYGENVVVQDITDSSIATIDGQLVGYAKLFLIHGVVGDVEWAKAIYTDETIKEYLEQYNLVSSFSIDEKSNQTVIYIVEKVAGENEDESLSDKKENNDQEVTDV